MTANAVSVGDYLRWAIGHQKEYMAIYEAGTAIMADFPGLGSTTPLGRLGLARTHTPVPTPEDEKLIKAIQGLSDDEVLTEDHAVMAMLYPHEDKVVRGRILGGRPPVIDPTTGQPVPKQPRFDGSFLKALLENLPSLMSNLPAIISMIQSLFPKPATV